VGDMQCCVLARFFEVCCCGPLLTKAMEGKLSVFCGGLV
jgi:hypothetical protein